MNLNVLKNGLRVVTERRDAESVAMGVFVRSGSRHETARTAGISHFIEHMLFKGTPTRTPLMITREIEGRGGNFNACTGEEMTCYYAQLPSEYLSEAVELLSDIYLRATIPDDEFAREKEVVIEEIRMYADEPDSVAMEKLQHNLFAGSQLGEPVAGSERSLRPLRPEDLRRYLKTHYRADNTVVVLVGDLDEAQALALVEREFAPLPRSRSVKREVADALKPVVPLAETTRRDIHEAQLALGYRAFSLSDERRYAAAVMDALLGRGMMSRLFQQVREKRGLSYDIASHLQGFSDTGMFTVTAGMPPAKGATLLKVVERELQRLAEHRVGAAELRRTQDFVTGNFRMGLEKLTSRMFYYGQTLLMYSQLVPAAEQVERVRAVTAEAVREAAAAIFRPENRSVSWVRPAVIT